MKYIFILLAIEVINQSCLLSQVQIDENIKYDSLYFENIKKSNHFTDYSTFILKYPYSVYFNQALGLYYKKRIAYVDSTGFSIGSNCFRNCAHIIILTNQNILLENETVRLCDLKDSLLTFLINKYGSISKSEEIDVMDRNGSNRQISKGYVKLSYVKDSCEILQDAINEISMAYTSYINLISKGWYNMDFYELESNKIQQLDSLFQGRLLLFELDIDFK